MAWSYNPITNLTNFSGTTSGTYTTYTSQQTALIRITCAYSGTLRFYSSNPSWRAVGYISSVESLSETTGGPTIPLGSSNTNGSSPNFDLSYSVEAGKKYFLWCRFYTGDRTGSIPYYISAPTGGGGTTTPTVWTAKPQITTNLSDTNYSSSDSLEKGQLHYHSFYFANSGEAEFIITQTTFPFQIYIASNGIFDNVNGIPGAGNTIYKDVTGSNSVSIKLNVAANTRYVLYVRATTLSGYGSFNLYVYPPKPQKWVQSEYNALNIDETTSKSLNIPSGFIYCAKVTFTRSGTATFYSTGNYDTIGFLSTNNTYNNISGEPTPWLVKQDGDGTGSNFSFTYDVTKDNTYYFWYRLKDYNSSGSVAVYIVPPAISIVKWDWSKKNVNASVDATVAAHTAITNKGDTTNFSYVVWNDMVDKVLEILDSKNYAWNTTYLNAANTKMSSSSKTLTASRFNSLRYNINLYSQSGIEEVSTGDTVYGSYFISLTNAINSWIDKL